MAMPVFNRAGELIGFAGSVAHLPDIGGKTWGADAREFFEEGLHLPPCHLHREYQPNETVLNIIRSNVRLSDQVLGDIYAQVSANEYCAKQLAEFVEETGLGNLSALSKAIFDKAERAMREAIRAIPNEATR